MKQKLTETLVLCGVAVKESLTTARSCSVKQGSPVILPVDHTIEQGVSRVLPFFNNCFVIITKRRKRNES